MQTEITRSEVTDADTLICSQNDYFLPTRIRGRLCAIHNFFATVGIVVGITEDSYECRYCFSEYRDAVVALMEWAVNPEEEHPGREWIKIKGRWRGRAVDCGPDGEDLQVKTVTRKIRQELTPVHGDRDAVMSAMVAFGLLSEHMPEVLPEGASEVAKNLVEYRPQHFPREDPMENYASAVVRVLNSAIGADTEETGVRDAY